ncbi:epidermal growth factor receptor kinase substrate 8-like [Pristis pectinata]|uniref:epidermal growth factor receptor kinase substrate 8-like n=1 Tax=Pristis pectinata TaxID=685728 RepID=UPI00223E4CFE|nr:epidermal growth factor receptor kinase substrate 8-like [Pristis pectinata]XP_051890806.1 epidermal growth factor receptor kinase substrate 8-like [Pristis pectinata]
MYGGYDYQHIPSYDENHSFVNGLPPEKPPFQKAQSTSNRPSAKAIYQQRKAYAKKLNSTDNLIQHRVEHLNTWDHNLNDTVTVEHCIQQLRKLHAEGKIWGQDMFLQLSDTSFRLADLETKDELENFPIDTIQDSRAVMNRCIYNSILAVTISRRHIMKTSTFLFQCEEVSADIIQHDVEKMIRRKKERGKGDMQRNTPGNMISQHSQPPYKKSPAPPPLRQGSALPNYDNNVGPAMSENGSWTSSETYTDSTISNDLAASESERNKEILNHVIDDIELFLDKIESAIDSNPQLKKKKKPGKFKDILPPESDYRDCLQKIKYAFNLLSQLEFQLDKPSASDFVHSMFQSLDLILENLPKKNLAKDVTVPLLMASSIKFLTSCTSTEEKKIWNSLGDAWHVPRSEWPNNESLGKYDPTFSDGWVLPPRPLQQHPPPPNQYMSNGAERPTKQVGNGTWQDRNPFERSQKFAKAIYDFTKRNPQELTVRADDVLEVLETSKQWWKVKDRNGFVGHIPHNILQYMDQEERVSLDVDNNRGIPYLPKAHSSQLTMHSTPSEVTAWLQDKGFSSSTVRSLGILTGSQLLSLSERELKMVSENEGHIVHDQIQRSQLPTHAWKTNY